jgi:hypothetical protein
MTNNLVESSIKPYPELIEHKVLANDVRNFGHGVNDSCQAN